MTEDDVRLDKWLWAARFFRHRNLARTAIEAGQVTVDGQRCKPARPARTGMRLQIARGDERFEIDVLIVSDQRGNATLAQTLYAETPASAEARARARADRAMAAAGLRAPPTRPDKHQRRDLERMKRAPDTPRTARGSQHGDGSAGP